MVNSSIHAKPQEARLPALGLEHLLFLLSISFALLGVLGRHSFQDQIGGIRYAPHYFALAAIAVLTLKHAIWGSPSLLFTIKLDHLAPTAALAALIAIGTTARHISDPGAASFRPHLISITGFALAIGFLSHVKCRTLTAYLFMGAGALAAGIALIGFLQGEASTHEYLFLIVPLCVPLLTSRRTPFVLMGLLWIAFWGICGLKNTTFIICVATLTLALTLRTAQRRPIGKWTLLAILPTCLLIPNILTQALETLRANIPGFSSGNTSVRQFFYRELLTRFKESPFTGTVFSESPVMIYPYDYIHGHHPLLPSHSDLLDILAHGGLLAATVFAAILWQTTRSGLRLLDQTTEGRRNLHWEYAATACACGIIQMAFNPVLHLPANGMLFWFVAGCLIVFSSDLNQRSASQV
ncbi:MAG: O-antigen ligase family protein [Planctomycetota bacterium]|jgi:hypothetical protein|nr:O-antigen ligase family protein [Planctomycetota bacterium]